MQVNTKRKKLSIAVTLAKFCAVTIVLFISCEIFRYSLVYFYPDFNHGFLSDKYLIFDGIYKYGLYVHCITAPVLITLSSLLIFFRFEDKKLSLHRTLGKVISMIALTIFIPSSIILAQHAYGGFLGRMLFYCLTGCTLICLIIAIYCIQQKKWKIHSQWMTRFYLLLLSGVLLRINQFVAHYYFNSFTETAYLWSAFLSWAPSILIYQLYLILHSKKNVSC